MPCPASTMRVTGPSPISDSLSCTDELHKDHVRAMRWLSPAQEEDVCWSFSIVATVSSWAQLPSCMRQRQLHSLILTASELLQTRYMFVGSMFAPGVFQEPNQPQTGFFSVLVVSISERPGILTTSHVLASCMQLQTTCCDQYWSTSCQLQSQAAGCKITPLHGQLGLVSLSRARAIHEPGCFAMRGTCSCFFLEVLIEHAQEQGE